MNENLHITNLIFGRYLNSVYWPPPSTKHQTRRVSSVDIAIGVIWGGDEAKILWPFVCIGVGVFIVSKTVNDA